MKKIIFYTSIVLSIILVVNIVKIIAIDFDRLTEYGFGYLAGRIILLLIFVTIAYFIKKLGLEVKRNSDKII